MKTRILFFVFFFFVFFFLFFFLSIPFAGPVACKAPFPSVLLILLLRSSFFSYVSIWLWLK